MEQETDSIAPQLRKGNGTISDPLVFENSRLSLPLGLRIPTAVILGFLSGFGLGASQGGIMAGMRFRAENSHRFPKSATGWYLYHKTKNYKIAFSSVKEGVKMGAKVSLWATSFLAVEEIIDIERGSKDFVSTAVAGLSVAGLFSAWNRFPMMTTVRTLQTGLYGGLAFGLLEDALALARGRRLRYVDFLKEVFGAGDRNLEEGNR